jgi:hypothetical protein
MVLVSGREIEGRIMTCNVGTLPIRHDNWRVVLEGVRLQLRLLSL